MIGKDGLVYWGLAPPQQPWSYQGGEMMMMKSVIWWRKPEYPEKEEHIEKCRGAVNRCNTKYRYYFSRPGYCTELVLRGPSLLTLTDIIITDINCSDCTSMFDQSLWMIYMRWS